MSNKKLMISVVTAALLASTTAVAKQTIELQTGWNLIGLQEKPFNSDAWLISSLVQTNSDILTITNVTRTYSSTSSRNSLTSLESGKGYWVNVSKDTNLTLDGTLSNYKLEELNPGWNLVTVPTNITDINGFIGTMNSRGYRINLITNVTRTYTVGASRNSLSSMDVNHGYWINSDKLALRAKTSDGIYLNFYANDTADTLDKNATSLAISALTYADIVAGNKLASNFANFSGEVVVATQDPNTDVITEKTHNTVIVSSSGISTSSLPSVETVVTNTTIIDKVVIYAYSITAGGAPQILSGATLVEVSNDGTETELGTSDSNGLIVPSKDIRGNKVILRASGVADMSISLDSNYSKPSYYAILAAGATEEITETTSVTPTNNRILGRITPALEREISQYNDVKGLVVYHMKQVSVKRGTKQQFTVTQNTVSEKTSLESALKETRFTPKIITALDVSLKDGSTNKTLNPSTTKFSDLYLNDVDNGGSHASDIDSFYIGLSGKDTSYNYDGLDANSIFNDTNATQGKLEVWMYKNNAWTKVQAHSKVLKVASLGDSDEEKNIKKRLKQSDFYIKLNSVGIGASDYDGYYPLAIVYKQESITQKSFTVTVKDSETQATIPNALVRLGATNYVTDANGSVELSVTVTGDGGLIPLSATEPKHLRTVSSVNPLTLSDTTSNNIELSLSPIPNSATITGTVLDSDLKSGVSNSLVEIINPISLDSTKITTRDGVSGIEVGLDSGAKYTWYIKEVPPSTSVGLGRVSQTSWMQVKEDKARNGNFISYNEIVKTLLKPGLVGESDAISGLFDIAVKIEHDVNGDGISDYTELATNGTNTLLNDDDNGTSVIGTHVADSFVKNYAKKIGQLKIALDAEKVAEASTNAADSGTVIFTTANHKYVQYTQSSTFEDENNDGSDEGKYANYDLSIGGGTEIRAFRIDGFSTDFVGLNASLTWKATIFADIVNSSGNVVSSVLLDENFKWKSLNNAKDKYEDLLKAEQGEILADNANYVIGSLKYVDGNIVSADSTISYKRLMRSLADDRIIKALNMSIAEIATQAGVNTTGVADTSIKMLKDGISLSVVADINYVRDPDDANESVRAILHTDGLTLKADKVEDLLTITDAPVSPLSQISGAMSTYSDRVGEFRFARVPYDFGKLNENNSLMRLKASRFDYFDNSVNIGAFEQLESQLTTVQQNIDIKARKSYSVTLDFKDGNTTNDASLANIVGTTVVMTGSKANNGEITTNLIGADGNLSALSRVIPNTSGLNPTYNDILEGYQSVMIFKDGFKAVEKKLNLRSNQIVTINWEPVGDPADFKAQIDIDYENSIVNYATGKAILSGKIYDKNDTSLSKDTQISLLLNNQPLNVKLVRSSETSPDFTVSFDLPKGESQAKIIATNDKGVSISSVVYYDYNPDFGSVKGNVSGVKADEYAIVSLYNEANEPVANAVPNDDGEYNFVSLAVGKYSMNAIAFDASGNDYPSNAVSVTVVGGQIISADSMAISHVSTALSGAPSVEFTTDDITLPTTDIALVATVNNFELGDDVSDRFAVVVNDVAYAVEKSDFTVTTTANNYTFNYSLALENLQSGQNVVYLVAVNKNGKYDFSADLYITTAAATSIASKDIEFVNTSTLKTIADDYIYMDLYTYNGQLKAHYLSDTNSTDNFITVGALETGKYVADIYTQNNNYIGSTVLVDVNSSGIYMNNTPLKDDDNDTMYEIGLRGQASLVANIAPTLDLPLNPLSMDSSDGNFTIYNIASDKDGDDLTITLGDYNNSVVTVIVDGYNLVVTPVGDGKISVPVSVTDGTDTVNGSFIVKVSTRVADNFAPSIFGTSAYNLSETNMNASITIVDVEGDDLNVSLTGYDSSVISATYADGFVNILALAHGNTSLTVNVNDGHHEIVSKIFAINVTLETEDNETVNNAPTIHTIFDNVVIEEDSGIMNYELNVSDAEGEDINVSVESNNTNILTVTPNFGEWITQATWANEALDFNFTTVPDANGMVQVTIIANDGDLNSTRSFDVNVTAVNDAPVLSPIPDVNSTTNVTIPVHATDIDSEILTYSASGLPTNVDINQTTGLISGSTTEIDTYSVIVTVSDGEANATRNFNLTVSVIETAIETPPTVPNIEDNTTLSTPPSVPSIPNS